MSNSPIETPAGDLPGAIEDWIREFSGDPDAQVIADVTIIKYVAHGEPMFGIATSLDSAELAAALIEIGLGIVRPAAPEPELVAASAEA